MTYGNHSNSMLKGWGSFRNWYRYLYQYLCVFAPVWQTIMKIILLKLPLSVNSAL